MYKSQKSLVKVLVSISLVLVSLLGSSAAFASTPDVQLAQDVSAFRTQAKSLLTQYQTQYSPGFTTQQRTQVSSLIAQTDKNLATWATDVAAVSRAKQPSARKTALKRAVASFTAGRSAADSAVQQVTPILQSQMNLFEQLNAKRDLDRMLSRFDELGARLKALK